MAVPSEAPASLDHQDQSNCKNVNPSPSNPQLEPLTYTRQQVAELLQIDADTVSELAARGEIPAPLVNRRRVMLWGRAQLQRWAEGQVRK